jgi:dUTPase
MTTNRIRFVKLRDVESPSRANSGDAGLDFYIPKDLSFEEIREANKDAQCTVLSESGFNAYGKVKCNFNTKGFITSFVFGPHTRLLIPSGIKVLIEPKNSMLMAANKSGISSKKGLVYTAEIVDSPYTGQIHIGIANLTNFAVELPVGKAIQFIHVPVYLTEPEEISLEDYEGIAKDWGTRGSNGFGSSDNK